MALVGCLAGCDQGKQNFASTGVGPPLHLIATNLGASASLPINGRIEMSFDRLLLPAGATRQSFALVNAQNQSVSPLPSVAYDPVARVVTVTPDITSLDPGQPYKLYLLSPSSASDPNGLRTIDGATLAPDSPRILAFTAAPASTTPTVQTPFVDYCRDIAPTVSSKLRCAACHLAPAPFAGLALDTPNNIAMTAIGKIPDLVAHGSNTGPTTQPEQASLAFAEDVPIIDTGGGPAGTAAFIGFPGPDGSAPQPEGGLADGAVSLPIGTGDPGHSWLMYKVLMAVPPACDPTVGPCDGGARPPDAGPGLASIANLYEVACSDAGDPCPQPLSDDERARLAALVPGREMPYPDPSAPLTDDPLALTLQELELLSLWIKQGASLPPSLSCGPFDGGTSP